MSDLKVAIIQEDIDWQAPAANRLRYGKHIESLHDVNLIVLPEMFSTGFYMKPWQKYEVMEGETVAWMSQLAEEKQAVVTGSLIMKCENAFVNRMIWAKPDGSLQWYDKRHLFRFGGEHHHFSSGNDRVIVTLDGWRILLLICYDLRFPVWSRNRDDYDVAVYVANWPNARQFAWDTLVKARAIENQCYVLACNRLGQSPSDEYRGGSVILNYSGQCLLDCKDNPGAGRAILCMDALHQFRQVFPALLDQDDFAITV